MSELEPNRTNGEQLPDYLNIAQGLVLTDLVIKATSRRHGDFDPVRSGQAMTPEQMRLYLAAPTVARLGGWGKGDGSWDGFVRYSPDTNTSRPMGVGGLMVLPPDVTSAQALAGNARTSSAATLAFPPGLSEIAFGTPTQSTGVIGGYALYGDTDFGFNARRRDSTGALTGGFGLSASGDMVMRDAAGLNKGGLSKGRFRGLEQTGASATSDPPPAGYMDFFPDSTTGHASRVNSAGVVVDLEAGGASLPKRYVEGLVIRYASSSTITVSAGKARDKADGADMTWAPASVAASTVDLTVANAALGGERKALTGTATFTNLSTAVTGSGTAFLTEFGVRSGTGTISAVTSSSITGTGTKFLSEVAVNDLIGTTAGGYSRVSVITSDTALQVDDSMTLSGAFGVIENPKIETAGGRTYVVGKIASDTSISLLSSTTATASEASVAVYAGSKRCTTGNASDGWRAVWLLSGGSGTTVAFSTQRTTPYLSITGYTTSYRRIGWVRINSSGNLEERYGEDGGLTRFTSGLVVFLVANANAAATDTLVDCNTAAPPTAQRLAVGLLCDQVNTVSSIRVSSADTIPTTSRELAVVPPSTSTSAYSYGRVGCNRAQQVKYKADLASGDGFYLSVHGYEDVLE